MPSGVKRVDALYLTIRNFKRKILFVRSDLASMQGSDLFRLFCNWQLNCENGTSFAAFGIDDVKLGLLK